MKIEKIVDVDGNVKVKIDGESINAETTRKLTGCQCGHLFRSGTEETFTWGEFSVKLYFNTDLDYVWPVEKIAETIHYRINKVREWVNSCKATAGSVEIKDLVDLVADLHAEGRLYYRTSKGVIKKLE